MERSIVSSRVALLLRSAEIKLLFHRFVHNNEHFSPPSHNTHNSTLIHSTLSSNNLPSFTGGSANRGLGVGCIPFSLFVFVVFYLYVVVVPLPEGLRTEAWAWRAQFLFFLFVVVVVVQSRI
jgi:hypothetical protein